MELQFFIDAIQKYYFLFLDGAKITLMLAFFTVILGTLLGVILALFKLSKSKILNLISSIYIEFLRGTPLLVQVFIIYFGLPNIGIQLPDSVAAIIALSFNSAAYVAEIIRAGIQAVDKGQTEAARSLGLSHRESMQYIIIPQAFKNILPALGNEFVTIIKESSIVSVIGIKELMFNTDTVKVNMYRAFEPLIICAFIYFILTFSLSKLMSYIERRLKSNER